MSVRDFLRHHYRHFNAATLVDAAEGYCDHLASDGRMMVTLAGAMSTAELGVSLARMIREDKVHAICCTGANLEEDVFNLIAHDHYERIPDWRALTAADEKALLDRHLNRVTDTCIPEEEAFRRIEGLLVAGEPELALAGATDLVARTPSSAECWAAFGEATSHFSEAWRVIVGAQYTEVELDFTFERTLSGPQIGLAMPVAQTPGDTSENDLSSKLAVQ